MCNIGFVERPLVIAFAWYLVTGDMMPAVPLAIFFELFWLDLFHLGGFIPPMAAFPYLLLLALAAHFGWTSPTELAFPLAASLPLAHIVTLYEYLLRKRQGRSSDLLLLKAGGHEPLGRLPGLMVYKASFYYVAVGLALFAALYWLCLHLFNLPLVRRNVFFPLNVDWAVLYAIAAIGALLSLRIRKVYLAFGLCMVAFVLLKAV
ncbi:hypothetical protein LJB82_01125 [Desulfovibrio sp. OttesenSCG-928-M16]|nr:hypothetical protein [Desulfovibrio sp. OttesenSCG-928-M16]